MIAARILVQLGTDPMNAIEAVRAVRPGAIETAPQEAWVRAGRSWSPLQPSTAAKATRDRAVGALVGLAAGDAVGTTIEFAAKPKYALIDDMVGRGPFGLKAGEWTDDTAMALALADSLLLHPEFDAPDLMNRFVQWHEKGSYSCTGTCFDIGNTVRAALATFKRTGNPMAGSSDPRAAGNGALMRLAPVAVRYFADRTKLRDVAARQTQTTHAAYEAVEASVLFAEILADAISGKPRSEVLAARSGSFSPKLQAIACGASWRGCHRDKIFGDGICRRLPECGPLGGVADH
jgi:ADP-ribosyl-[dinitrogen reductase] hydrolase